jgi:hypothetical protein
MKPSSKKIKCFAVALLMGLIFPLFVSCEGYNATFGVYLRDEKEREAGAYVAVARGKEVVQPVRIGQISQTSSAKELEAAKHSIFLAPFGK